MIFIVTNRKLVKGEDFFHRIEQAVSAGAEAIILREKDLSFEELLRMAKQIKRLTDGHKTRLIINGSLEVARAVCANGIHLSFERYASEKPEFGGLIGVSVHSVEEAIRAEDLGATYILAGHIYNTECKKGVEPKGVSLIREIKACVKIPCIAIGGITEYNCNEILRNGAQGIAVMSSIMESGNCFERIVKLKYNMARDTIA